MFTIYHNPRCRKSREALQYLEDQNCEVKIVNYLKEPFTKERLQVVLDQIKLKPSEVLRKNETEWKTLPNKNQLNENEILDILIRFPKTLERPVVIDENSGVFARPLENLISFLNRD